MRSLCKVGLLLREQSGSLGTSGGAQAEELSGLTWDTLATQNPDSAGTQAPSATGATFHTVPVSASSFSGQREIVDSHEHDQSAEPQEPR
jgi:hypothetical protein